MTIGKLPECEADFAMLAQANLAPFFSCVVCDKPFSKANTHTKEGWRETQVTGFCENCFDETFNDEEDEDGQD